MSEGGTKRVVLNIAPPVHKQLKLLSAETGESLYDLGNEALKDFIAKRNAALETEREAAAA